MTLAPLPHAPSAPAVAVAPPPLPGRPLPPPDEPADGPAGDRLARVLRAVGDLAARRPWRVLGAWAALAAVALVLAVTSGGTLAANHELPGTDAQAAADLLHDRFPEQAGTGARIVLHGQRLDAAVLAQVAERAAGLDHVAGVAPPQLSPDGRTAVLAVQYDVVVTDLEPLAALTGLERAAAPARQAGLRTEFGGEVVDNVFEQGPTEAIGLALAGVVLLVALGSVVAAGLPLAIALVGVGVGMSLVLLLANAFTISPMAPTIAAMVGIGVGIDYALFVVSRHRQQLRAGVALRRSVALANASAGRSVVFAGCTVLVSICGLALSGVPEFVMMGFATAVVVGVSMLAAVTVLPALLALAGTRVLPRRSRTAGTAAAATRPGLTGRWARQATARPWAYGVASLAVLLALGAPVLAMDLGQGDAGSNPTSSTSRRAYDLVSAGFGPGANGPLLVTVDLRQDAVDLASLRAELAGTRGVAAVAAPRLNGAGDTAVLTVVPLTGPEEPATERLVHALRDEVLPDAARVTGATAVFLDFNQVLQDNLPRVVVAVVATSFLLLVLVFRSVVAPLKAAVMNLLSVGAAYGAIVALFQWGWGADALGLDGPVPVSAFVPLFMFAVLFGLSMDYEVFLLSRVREEWDRTGDSRASVVAAVTSTGRVITSAALIMVTVFAGFAADDLVAVKMMGVGMATAILVDATLVRLVLVPATMVLLGRWNWWLPGWLDRLLPAPEGPVGEASQEPAGSLVTSAS